jgi:uncharacterized protein (DUF4415 family)
MKQTSTTSKSATKPKSQTDWNRVMRMRDEEIDYSDIPKTTPEEFARAVVRRGLKPKPPKEAVSLRLDQDVLEWFRARGKGYQTEINVLLRAYMEALEE